MEYGHRAENRAGFTASGVHDIGNHHGSAERNSESDNAEKIRSYQSLSQLGARRVRMCVDKE